MGAVAQLPAGRDPQPAAVPLRSRGLATSLVRAAVNTRARLCMLHAVTAASHTMRTGVFLGSARGVWPAPTRPRALAAAYSSRTSSTSSAARQNRLLAAARTVRFYCVIRTSKRGTFGVNTEGLV